MRGIRKKAPRAKGKKALKPLFTMTAFGECANWQTARENTEREGENRFETVNFFSAQSPDD